MKSYVEPEWIRNVEEKVNELSIENHEGGLDSEDRDNSDDDYDEEEDYFCVACDKSFKSDKAFKNHEKSKKHKENIDLLKKTMKEEDLNMFFKTEENEKNEDDKLDEESNGVQEEKSKNR